MSSQWDGQRVYNLYSIWGDPDDYIDFRHTGTYETAEAAKQDIAERLPKLIAELDHLGELHYAGSAAASVLNETTNFTVEGFREEIYGYIHYGRFAGFLIEPAPLRGTGTPGTEFA